MSPTRKSIFATGALTLNLFFAGAAKADSNADLPDTLWGDSAGINLAPTTRADEHGLVQTIPDLGIFKTADEAMENAELNITRLTDRNFAEINTPGQIDFYEKQVRENLAAAVKLDPKRATDAEKMEKVTLPQAIKTAHLNAARHDFAPLAEQAKLPPLQRDSNVLMTAKLYFDTVKKHLKKGGIPIAQLDPTRPAPLVEALYGKVEAMVKYAEEHKQEIYDDHSIGSPTTAPRALMVAMDRITALKNSYNAEYRSAPDIVRTAAEAQRALTKAAKLDPALEGTVKTFEKHELAPALAQAHIETARAKFLNLVGLVVANEIPTDRTTVLNDIEDVKENLSLAGKKVRDLDPASPPAFVEKIFDQTVKVLTAPVPLMPQVPDSVQIIPSPSRQQITM